MLVDSGHLLTEVLLSSLTCLLHIDQLALLTLKLSISHGNCLLQHIYCALQGPDFFGNLLYKVVSLLTSANQVSVKVSDRRIEVASLGCVLSVHMIRSDLRGCSMIILSLFQLSLSLGCLMRGSLQRLALLLNFSLDLSQTLPRYGSLDNPAG